VTLEAVEVAALAGASSSAEAIRQAARARAGEIVTAARAEAAELIARRRAAAERAAQMHERERLAAARSAARARVLHAQHEVLGEVTAGARAAARRLADDPRYAPLRERFAAEARVRLAGPAGVEIIAAAHGGLIARAGSRQLDYSLDAQVDRCLRAMAGELERLWS